VRAVRRQELQVFAPHCIGRMKQARHHKHSKKPGRCASGPA
jgi:hypothetical protein